MTNQLTNEQIDALLDQHRPDRYSADDHAWRAPVVAAVATRVEAAQARQIAAERIVSQREATATRSVNAMFRKVNAEKQWPLLGMFDDLARRPLSIGGERVRYDSATEVDLDKWAINERRDAAQSFAARSDACDGAEWIAEQLRLNGHRTVGEAHAARAAS